MINTCICLFSCHKKRLITFVDSVHAFKFFFISLQAFMTKPIWQQQWDFSVKSNKLFCTCIYLQKDMWEETKFNMGYCVIFGSRIDVQSCTMIYWNVKSFIYESSFFVLKNRKKNYCMKLHYDIEECIGSLGIGLIPLVFLFPFWACVVELR